MNPSRLLTRRAVLKDMGRAGLAIVVFGAACTAEPGSTPTSGGPGESTTIPGTGATNTEPKSSTTQGSDEGTRWARVNMGFVSAYLLYRSGEATLVDTGQSGSASAIEATIGEVGLGWDSVSHIIATHKHPDHIGSLDAVSALAPDATIHVGAGDADAIGAQLSESPVVVGDGDLVFDLEVIETPGHTPGHISILDRSAAILVAGDALNSVGGTLNPSDPEFTEDLQLAADSVRKLAGFDYEIVLFGHGEPLLSGGSEQVAALASSGT